MKRRDYARRIINPYLDFKQTILEAYNCGRAARNAAKFTGSHNSIKLKLCCLSILEGAEWGQRQRLYSSTEAFLAWALHCWGLQRICTHPADPKSSELVRLWSVIPAWLWAAPPIYIPLLSRSWIPQEQLTDGPASLGLCCPELCCAKRSSSCSLSFLQLPRDCYIRSAFESLMVCTLLPLHCIPPASGHQRQTGHEMLPSELF